MPGKETTGRKQPLGMKNKTGTEKKNKYWEEKQVMGKNNLYELKKNNYWEQIIIFGKEKNPEKKRTFGKKKQP